MPTDIATYVVAQREGVKIAKYLDETTLQTVAEFDSRLAQKEGGQSAPLTAPGVRAERGRSASKAVDLTSINLPVGILSTQQTTEAHRMAGTVYPLLYVFENSARSFVRGHLEAVYGKDWWDDPKLVPNKVRKVVARNKAASGKERWVVRANPHPIYLTELGHLADIIISEHGWKVFKPPVFPRQSWVVEHFRTIEAPRNVVAHMNSLTASNIQGLQTRCREWFDQIAGHLPSA
jgi:hypothetical protein